MGRAGGPGREHHVKGKKGREFDVFRNHSNVGPSWWLVDTNPLLGEEMTGQCYLTLFPGQTTSSISERGCGQGAGKSEMRGTLCCPTLPGQRVSYPISRDPPPQFNA